MTYDEWVKTKCQPAYRPIDGRENRIMRAAYSAGSRRTKELENRLFELGAMESPPCFCCGYNGPGYYQPDKHKCAERQHRFAKKD